MAKATRKAKRKPLSKPPRRTRVGHYERGRIECIVASGERAHQLVNDAWSRAADLTPVMVSAILRDLLIEIGAVKGAANNLAEAYLDREPGAPS
jgi:hypothetical protein